ncbi:MAG: hypothetical protein NTU44_13985 [Bacteroidetes bacterium]|nr:hypothetical protein [Bacteroidota bacterium]
MPGKLKRLWIVYVITLIVVIPVVFWLGTRFNHYYGYAFFKNETTVDAAKKMYQKWVDSNANNPGFVKCLIINKEQFEAMNNLFISNEHYNQYVIVNGVNDNNDTITMVIGTQTGTNTETKIYVTSKKDSGLCPTLCEIPNQVFKFD